MGQSKSKVMRFIQDNPLCIFCGGLTPSTTIDHVPARCLFIGRKWPEGYKFPACEKCNNQTSDAEFLFSFLLAMGWENVPNFPHSIEYSKEVMQNFIIRKRHLSTQIRSATTNQKRAFLRESGSKLPVGTVYSDLPLARVPKDFHLALIAVGTKIAKALHFLHTGNIAPQDSEIIVIPESNADWSRGDPVRDYPVLQQLPLITNLKRDRVDLLSQFAYSYGTTENNRNSIFLCTFGTIISIAMLVIVDQEYIED